MLIISISQASYLAAFSCEISWILEAHGDLPTISYLLCSGYFILFVASTILIHGLATVRQYNANEHIEVIFTYTYAGIGMGTI